MSIRLRLLHLTPRLYITRIVILACIWLILYPAISPIRFRVEDYIFLGTAIVHHLLCLTVPLRFFYGVFDLFLLLGELLASLRFGISLGPSMKSWMPELYISLKVLAWITFSCLLLLFVFRLSKMLQTRGRCLIEAFTIFPRGYPEHKKPHMLKMLFGRSLWSVHFVGEKKTVQALRGLLGLTFLATIVFWSFSSILFEPMKETALGPVREFRTRRPPADFISSIDYPVWNIMTPALKESSQQPPLTLDSFNQSVTVKAVWAKQADLPETPPCKPMDVIGLPNNPDVYQFLCSAAQDSAGTNFLPDISIRVNFSLIESALSQTSPTLAQISLPIIIGLTNSNQRSIKHIFEQTPPITLIPGVNLAAPITTDIRQIFAHPAMAALGLFQDTSVFWEARFEHMYTDVSVPETDRDPNIATLRLFSINNWADTRVIQDYRMNSVIAGFADVGGLWTSLSGIFTVLFGSKPLSIFGIAHAFHHKHMKEETLRLYPNIVNEHKELKTRGLLALLRDHLIDLNFLEKEFVDITGPLGNQSSAPLTDIEKPLVEDPKASDMAELDSDSPR